MSRKHGFKLNFQDRPDTDRNEPTAMITSPSMLKESIHIITGRTSAVFSPRKIHDTGSKGLCNTEWYWGCSGSHDIYEVSNFLFIFSFYLYHTCRYCSRFLNENTRTVHINDPWIKKNLWCMLVQYTEWGATWRSNSAFNLTNGNG